MGFSEFNRRHERVLGRTLCNQYAASRPPYTAVATTVRRARELDLALAGLVPTSQQVTGILLLAVLSAFIVGAQSEIRTV